MYRLVSEGIASALQSADKEASLVVLELIRETAPWDEPKENPHTLYKDGLITGKEYLEFLSTMCKHMGEE